MFSTSSPTYPASVSVVASAMVKGTSIILASVVLTVFYHNRSGQLTRCSTLRVLLHHFSGRVKAAYNGYGLQPKEFFLLATVLLHNRSKRHR